jgi:hypothetical protein
MEIAEQSTTRNAMSLLWRTFLTLLFAAWWGGLTFYAIVVVPIGSEQIGSASQGFITQGVTVWHNGLLTAMTVCVLAEAWRSKNRWLLAVGAGMVLIDAALLIEHSQLSGMLDFGQRTVTVGFYERHAVYLWLTAAEWGLGIAVALVAGFGCSESGQRKSPTNSAT